MNRRLPRGWPFFLFAAALALGAVRGDLVEILHNASLLCLSCMGLSR